MHSFGEEEKAKKMQRATAEDDPNVILPPDIMEKILSRLPARSFAAAASTCRSWNCLCDRILSQPKLLSALSSDPRLSVAVEEACESVLSEPIRPHFAISFIGSKFSLKETLRLIKGKLGSSIPIITCYSPGIIGRNAKTKEFDEVQWVSDSEEYGHSTRVPGDHGIVLTVGFVPGLKVAAMPVRHVNEEGDPWSLVDLYFTNVKRYVESVSGSLYPTGMIIFADAGSDMTYFLESMVLVQGFLIYAFVANTQMVHATKLGSFSYNGRCGRGGDRNKEGCFLFNGGEYLNFESECRKVHSSQSSTTKSQGSHKRSRANKSFIYDVVALVFAKDKENLHGMGDIQFSLALSAGLSSVGPIYKAASVKCIEDKISGCSTWMTARRDGFPNLDGQALLDDLESQVGNEKACNAFYIRVFKRRKPAFSFKKRKLLEFISLHEVTGADDEYLFVDGGGIRTGDLFQFCAPDVDSALASRRTVLEKFRCFKDGGLKDHSNRQDEHERKRVEVFGGLIFACIGRGELFFGRPSIDSSTFLEVFPHAPLSGVFCGGEIGPCTEECGEENLSSYCLNRYSTVFLVMTYSPKLPAL
ncbi:F-box/LRR-repeat protein At5g63520 isoform X2 [Nymphaea colorata]|uniref:F-box/LRR-repeat protein At5g63520 isoform X2 n=1 Tax=Nymphaea colorata TaxID=210225 RepID=UPI00129E1F99|nr:F-box/LRR-repeat protein At5g63520 isoform X2 [Nymphaea colorata]